LIFISGFQPLHRSYIKQKFNMLMRNSLYLFLLFAVFFSGISSCSNTGFLEQTVTSDLDHDKVFSDSAFTEGFLTDIYRNIGFDVRLNRFQPDGWGKPQAGGLQTACDEFEFRIINDITTDVMFAQGTVNPVVIKDDAFKIPYENIRKVNIFLSSVDRSPLSEGLRTRYKAEARFLRAWYYFIMLKHYGGIPLIGDVVYVDKDVVKTKRDNFEDCVDYIVSECTAASRDLTTIKPAGRYNGRVGIAACYALISRVKLYAASKLFNGSKFGSDVTGFPYEILGYKEYDKNRWREAMEAAEAVINLRVCSLYVNNTPTPGEGWYMSQFAADLEHFSKQGMVPQNSRSDLLFAGAILDHKKEEGNQRENLFHPPSRNSGGGGYPYQEFVNMFPMLNGKAIDEPGSGYDPNNPFANRDPRLKNSVLYDLGVVNAFINQTDVKVPISIYIVRETGLPATIDGFGSGTPTGFYNYKLVHRDVDGANNFTYHSQCMPLLRYVETLLNYAEAANEWNSSPTEQIYEALCTIREAAGITPGTDKMYGLKPNMNQDEMREAIRLERRIELAVEGHRFFDVRRWMIAEETENKMMHGVKVIRNEDQSDPEYIFNIPVRQHTFRKQYYFWPLPDKEVKKAKDMYQNPYYQ